MPAPRPRSRADARGGGAPLRRRRRPGRRPRAAALGAAGPPPHDRGVGMTPEGWALLFAGAAAVAVVTVLLAWRRRDRTPAATALAVTMSGVALWSTSSALIYASASVVVQDGYPALLMASVGLTVAGIYALARSVVDPSWRPTRRALLLLAVEPVVMVALAALPATRDLVLAGHGPGGTGAE